MMNCSLGVAVERGKSNPKVLDWNRSSLISHSPFPHRVCSDSVETVQLLDLPLGFSIPPTVSSLGWFWGLWSAQAVLQLQRSLTSIHYSIHPTAREINLLAIS